MISFTTLACVLLLIATILAVADVAPTDNVLKLKDLDVSPENVTPHADIMKLMFSSKVD